eukprot:CAMPEP_0174351328 /NCGR_PEP_ID=MMETSP0811_2-20130205/8661_1 /TAXON_ID=73025 ORGANISM="Eutreptiella gymnastica-like, Strain CCMP1594" /NCGR_SAMPLE_ID=MMETSP0811_2 /ASSEMBLY_ACC=CAM_ASM_000667 /LENGTH=135 /DNA_ID=CAMNT_0015480437 /DNA_START=58 /DNA_END=466 /DNA_ORIENTATION=+
MAQMQPYRPHYDIRQLELPSDQDRYSCQASYQDFQPSGAEDKPFHRSGDLVPQVVPQIGPGVALRHWTQGPGWDCVWVRDSGMGWGWDWCEEGWVGSSGLPLAMMDDGRHPPESIRHATQYNVQQCAGGRPHKCI